MRYNKKEGKPCGVLPFYFWLHFHSQDLPEPYTSSRPLKQENITPEGMWRFNCFLWVGFHSQNFPEHPFSLFFLRIHLHSQNLPEAYSWMRGKKQTQNQNLPEAYTCMRYNKKEGKACGVLPFFLTSFSQPGPAVPEPYTSSRPLKQENITPEWMRYNKKRG